MIEHNSPSYPIMAEREQSRAVAAQHDRAADSEKKFETPLQKFNRAKEEALARLPAVRGMTYAAIRETYPNLIKRVHYEELTFTSPDGERTEPVFTLWTTDGHAMTADGLIVARDKNSNRDETFSVVDESELGKKGLTAEETLKSLTKTLGNMPMPRAIRTERGTYSEQVIDPKAPYED